MNLVNQYYSWREKYLHLAVELIKKTYMVLLHPHRIPWDETNDSLRRYDYGTLGHELYRFLEQGDISLEAKYESHDVYHVLSGYGLGIVNEARLFFFLFGNGKKTVSIIGSMIIAILFMPDQWTSFLADYEKGKGYLPIHTVDYRDLLDTNFLNLRDTLKQKARATY